MLSGVEMKDVCGGTTGIVGGRGCTAWGGQNTGGGRREELRNSSENTRKQSASLGGVLSKVFFFSVFSTTTNCWAQFSYLHAISAYEIQSTNFTLTVVAQEPSIVSYGSMIQG